MNKCKVISVVGARPQFIKLAAMHKAILQEGTLKHIIVHSGQHYDFDMSGQFFEELAIPEPDYNLEIGSGHHIIQMAKCMTGLIDVFEKEKPDMMLVYGDTNTTAAAAITASKCNLKIAHIEAGLREWDKSIPEEVNKLLTDAVTDLYFTPTETGRQNLAKEGKTNQVYVTGDISLDLLYDLVDRTPSDMPGGDYVFMTCHRAANTDDPGNLKEILSAVKQIKQKVIFAMHPRTRKAIDILDPNWTPDHVIIIDPPGFWDTQAYIKNAKFVLTDSGGIIKEAYFHKVPAIIIDKQTEWVETVEEGWNTIAGPNSEKILQSISKWRRPQVHTNCMGDGKAGQRIISEIINSFHV
jgi:UDP-GlcNAc3NAcA epimerase